MPDYDPYSIQLADEPTALEMARARAAALRGQNFAGTVLGLAHDPNAARLGGEMMQQAQQGQDQLGQAPGERMRQALQRGQLQAQQREAAPFTDPAQAALLSQGQQQAAKMFGGSIPAGASPTTGQMLLQQMEKAAAIPKFTGAGYGTTGTINTKTGQYTPFPSTGAGGAVAGYTPEAIDIMARKGNATGKIELPPGVRGPGAMQLGQAVLQRMSELNPKVDLAGAAASYHADTASQAVQQKMLDNAESWENTGKKNLGVLLGIAQKLKDTGSPWLNKPVRAFFEKGMGDPNQAAFKAAHAAVVNEYAKILSGSQGGGAVTEGAHREAESMFPMDATMEQWTASAGVLDTDAANRIGSMREQLGRTKARASGNAPAPDSAAAGPAPAAGGAAAAAATPKPDVRARIAQLKASGAAGDALRQTLKAEYTADELKAAVGGGR